MALLVSIVVTFFLYVRIKRQFARATQPVKVVVTSKALEPGKPLALEDLTLVDWPVNLPLAGAINKPESVVGRIVLYPVAAQEPIREELLAAPGASVGLSAKIPDGMRLGFPVSGLPCGRARDFPAGSRQGRLDHGDSTTECRST